MHPPHNTAWTATHPPSKSSCGMESGRVHNMVIPQCGLSTNVKDMGRISRLVKSSQTNRLFR